EGSTRRTRTLPRDSSFKPISNGTHNFFGKSNWATDPDFDGQMDELRVWRVARTAGQIHDTMSRQLSGQKPGLVGLGNFDDGTARDLTTNGYHGKLVGTAKVVRAARPAQRFDPSRPLANGKVLELGGTNSYVELPPHIFTNNVVTVEGWVLFRDPGV